MKREIKFRIWDTETMYNYGDYVNEEGCDCHVVGICNEKVIIEERCKDDSNYGQIRISRMDELTIMQYTGLKDTNGIEIYEGDIIKYPNGKCGVVQWMSEEDGYDTTGWVTSYNNYNCTGNGNLVIGNIYENPELLTSDGKN